MSVVINYTSNEKVFIKILLKECKKFSDDIVVSYGSHLFDGTPENIVDIELFFPEIVFVKYDIDILANKKISYYNNLARWTGIQKLKNDGWVFLLNASEIPDGYRVKDFLCFTQLRNNLCYQLSTYWYFKKPIYEARTLDDSIILIKKKYLTNDNIFHDDERYNIIKKSQCFRQTMGLDDQPFMYDYSWVKNRKDLLYKIIYWCELNEYTNIDEEKMIEYIFKDDKVNDIVHGFTYDIVPNKFNINID